MGNTFSNLFYHIVFSTKGRVDFIDQEIERRVWAYIGGVARKNAMTALKVGGIENHAHTLIMAKTVHSPGQIAQWVKGESSKWLHEEISHLSKFCWRGGVGGFKVRQTHTRGG